LTKVDVFSNCIIFNNDDEQQKITSNHISPNAGLTIEEAKAQQEKDLKPYEESLESQKNKTKSPWAISMGVNSVEAVDNSTHKQGPIEINGTTYYFTQQNGKTTYYDNYGKVVDINKIPPPPPIPNNATPEQKAKMKKATEAYMKANPDKVGKAIDENGETIEVIEVPEDLQGSLDINGETFYYTTSNGKTTYYNGSGKEVKMDNLPPPPPTPPASKSTTKTEDSQNKTTFYSKTTDIKALNVTEKRTEYDGIYYHYEIKNTGNTIIPANSYSVFLKVNGKTISFDKATSELKPGQTLKYKSEKTFYKKDHDVLNYALEIKMDDSNLENNILKGQSKL
jgi:plastocyanin/YHS domain-containing protein